MFNISIGMILKLSKMTLIAVVIFSGVSAHAESWTAVTGEKALKALYSDVMQEGALTNNVKWETEYCADGKGLLRAWGESFPRNWQVKDENTVCITSDDGDKIECYQYEKSKV